MCNVKLEPGVTVDLSHDVALEPLIPAQVKGSSSSSIIKDGKIEEDIKMDEDDLEEIAAAQDQGADDHPAVEEPQAKWAASACHQLLIMEVLKIKSNRLRFCWNCYSCKWYKPGGCCLWSGCAKFGFDSLLATFFENEAVVNFVQEIQELLQANHTKDTLDFDSIQLEPPPELHMQFQIHQGSKEPQDAKHVLLIAKSKASGRAPPTAVAKAIAQALAVAAAKAKADAQAAEAAADAAAEALAAEAEAAGKQKNPVKKHIVKKGTVYLWRGARKGK